MKIFTILFSIILFSSILISGSKNILPIIPKPAKMEVTGGEFVLKTNMKILFDNSKPEMKKNAEFLSDLFSIATGFKIKIESSEAAKPKANTILLTLKNPDKNLGDEGYELIVSKNSVTVKANKPVGIFYGIQSIRQLLPPEISSKSEVKKIKWTIPCVKIEDKPRFSWRGMHLDVSRHFFKKDFILKYIDYLSQFKMNVFHWHLTDDNGWRLEIKKYPKLAEISAWRVDREDSNWRRRALPKEGEKATYGGFYTQEDVKEVIKYAAERSITVVPEIEMPAHSVEVLAAYPELSCTGGPFYVQPGSYWPNIDIFCAGSEKTFEFLEAVLDEVCELFPSNFIHIGGDEANKTNWKKCPKCHERIIKEGLKNEDELQSYFVKRIEKYLISKGRRLIGWDEILEGGLAPEATVMSWRGIDGGIAAAKSEHSVVMTPTSHCYFDYYQARNNEPEAIGGYLPPEKVYSYEPMPTELRPDQQKFILGAQGNVWTEFIPTNQQVEYMIFPRMCALSEVVWTPKELKNYDDFVIRMFENYKNLNSTGTNYFIITPKIKIDSSNTSSSKSIKVEILKPSYGEIKYTIDGTEPNEKSLVYKEPFVIKQKDNNNILIQAKIFLPNKRISPYSTEHYLFK